jgi:hypothetical protein
LALDLARNPQLANNQQRPKRRNLVVCLEAKLQSGNFLIQKVKISKKTKHPKEWMFLKKFISFYITPLEWSVFKIDALTKFTLSEGLI